MRNVEVGNDRAGQEPMPSWKRRGGAFLVDYCIFFLVWAAVDNLLYFPLPEVLLSLLSLALFCAYFVILEGVLGRHASVGKRFFGLRVVARNVNMSLLRSAVARSLIVGALVVVSWQNMPLALPWIPVPTAIVLVLGAAQLSLVLYNIWLSGSRWDDHLMLQDRWTTTRVVGPSWTIEAEGREVRLIPNRMGLALLFLILTAGIVSFALVRKQDLRGFSYRSDDPRRSIQRMMSQELGIRTRAEVETKFVWRPGQQTPETRLQIKLWIPYARWDENSLGKYSELAVSDLQVPPGYFDSGQMTLWTGGLLRTGRTVELNLPQ